MQSVIITGRITKDLVLKNSGEYKLCDFTLATNRPVNRDGERVADFINCIVWNKQAENLVKYQKKGNMIAVFGEIRTDTYEIEGKKKYKTYVLVNNIEFLEKKNDMDKINSKTITQETITYDDSDLPWGD